MVRGFRCQGRWIRVIATAQLCVFLAPSLAAAGNPPPLPVPPPPQSTGQSGAQQNAGNTNGLASTLGKALGVLSMAAGGLFIAKGAQELSCCAQGCNTGAGAAAAGTENGLQGASGTAAHEVQHTVPKRQPVDYFHLRFPDGAQNMTPRFRTPFPMIRNFFQPTMARANGCLDGAISLATGGLMLLNGILGLSAASQAGNNAGIANSNAGNMGSYNPTGGATSPTGSSANNGGPASSGLGAGGDSGSSVKMDPSLLHTGTANDIMGQFEKKFGMQRDAFAENVLGGEDPRKLLATAPKNALAVKDINAAMTAAKNMSDADKEKALAGTQLAQAQNEMTQNMAGAGTDRAPSGEKGTAIADGKKDELDPLGLDAKGTAIETMGLSPEVQAALLAKQLEASKVDVNLMTLFERVHVKYKEKSKMIFGYDPDGVIKGVGDANGN
jgi:hypothetical protein